MNDGERLRYLRKEVLGMTLDEFGKRIGIQKSGVSKIERGENSLTDQMILSICNANWNGRRVSETWLRTGEGDPFEPEPEDEIGRLARAHNLDENYASILRGLVQLDGEYQRMAVEFLMETAGRIAGKEKGWWKKEGEEAPERSGSDQTGLDRTGSDKEPAFSTRQQPGEPFEAYKARMHEELEEALTEEEEARRSQALGAG